MNPNALHNLMTAARRAYDSAAHGTPETAPAGFATRVVAKAKTGATQRGLGTLDLLERLGWGGVAASAAICVLAVTLQSRPPSSNPFEILLEAPANTSQATE